jgi:hypothetical protein
LQVSDGLQVSPLQMGFAVFDLCLRVVYGLPLRLQFLGEGLRVQGFDWEKVDPGGTDPRGQ